MKHNQSSSILGHSQDKKAEVLRANYRKIERREWWLWLTAGIITLLLTSALLSFLIPNSSLQHDIHYLALLPQAMRGLVGLVLLFDVYVI